MPRITLPKDESPTIKLQELSAVKALAKGIPSDAALVSKGRTGFFQEEYEKEEKWLGGYSI